MGRNDNSEGTRAPTTDSRPIPPELDSHLWNRKPTVQHYRMWSPAATSHVLLAACCQGEEAKELEVDGVHYGRFTYHLLAVLRRLPFATTTYAELSEQIRVRLPIGQTAHCGGSRRHRLVFHGGYPSTGRYSVPLVPCTATEGSTWLVSPQSNNSNSSKTFLVEMGAVEGVVEGTEFSAYAPDNSFLCTFVAQSVRVAQTILVSRTKPRKLVIIPSGSRVKVSDWKNESMILRVDVPHNFPYTADLFEKTYTDRKRNFEPAPSLEEAHIVVRSDGNKIVIERRTSMMLQCRRHTCFSLEGNPTHLPDVMDGIAHFNYFLEHSNGEENTLKGNFTLEMHRLEGQYPHRQRHPENMIKDNEARFTSKVGAKYGFTIRNASPENVFPYLFYFDPEDYTIERLYGPAGAHVEAPLWRDGELTIGIGSERGFQFALSSGDSAASGFLKLFVAREYIDLDIEQRLSPFNQLFGAARGLTVKQEEIPIWDALTVFVRMTAQ